MIIWMVYIVCGIYIYIYILYIHILYYIYIYALYIGIFFVFFNGMIIGIVNADGSGLNITKASRRPGLEYRYKRSEAKLI